MQPEDLAAHAAHRQLAAVRRCRARRTPSRSAASPSARCSTPARAGRPRALQCQSAPCASPPASACIACTVWICPSPGSSQACAGAVHAPAPARAVPTASSACGARRPAPCARARASTRCAAPTSPRCASSRLPSLRESHRRGRVARAMSRPQRERAPAQRGHARRRRSPARPAGLSMPAAVQPAAPARRSASGRPGRTPSTRCPARASCHASSRPSRPAPAMPIFMAQAC